MTKKEKRLQKFLNNPTALSSVELFNLALDLGFEYIPNKSGTSHHKITKRGQHFSLPIHNGDCSDGVKRKFYKFLQAMGEI